MQIWFQHVIQPMSGDLTERGTKKVSQASTLPEHGHHSDADRAKDALRHLTDETSLFPFAKLNRDGPGTDFDKVNFNHSRHDAGL